MLKTALMFLLSAAAFALPAHANSASASASFDASLTIMDACSIDSDGSHTRVDCRHASAWRVDGATVTF